MIQNKRAVVVHSYDDTIPPNLTLHSRHTFLVYSFILKFEKRLAKIENQANKTYYSTSRRGVQVFG